MALTITLNPTTSIDRFNPGQPLHERKYNSQVDSGMLIQVAPQGL